MTAGTWVVTCLQLNFCLLKCSLDIEFYSINLDILNRPRGKSFSTRNSTLPQCTETVPKLIFQMKTGDGWHLMAFCRAGKENNNLTLRKIRI